MEIDNENIDIDDDRVFNFKDLTCILFPGVVKNEERALQCLGGVKYISQVYSNTTKKRLGLSFQPENPYVKRIYADGKRTAGLLLKVKVKKKKVGNDVKRQVVSTSVLGRVKSIFRFQSMCDFQFMPAFREENGPLRCGLDEILLTGLDDVDVMKEPSQSFIVPSTFTRNDEPVSYSYTDKRYIKGVVTNDNSDDDGEVHTRVRRERRTPGVKIDFNLVDDLPTEPNEFFLKTFKKKSNAILEEQYKAVEKMFQERPIWSQNLLRYHTKIKQSVIKMILPCISYHMKSGPWRMFWVRYGYDPRKDPGARKYQLLDFRLRQQGGINSMVVPRDQVTNCKKSDRVKYRRKKQFKEENLATEEVNKNVVMFSPGMVPGQRQTFYMYCDINIPEVEKILAPEPPPGYLCHLERGWLPPNANDTCRDHIFRYVKEALLSTHNADVSLLQGSSDDGSNSDDADDGSSSEEPSTSNA